MCERAQLNFAESSRSTSLLLLTVFQFWLHCVRYAGLQLNSDFSQLDYESHYQQQQQEQQQPGLYVPSIVIIGMRGCGKTTIGQFLARSTSRDFYDCDECLQRSIAQGGNLTAFIEEHGWQAFRTEEVRQLQSILRGDGGQPTQANTRTSGAAQCFQHAAHCAVISTGGGIVETAAVKIHAARVCCARLDSILSQGRDLLKQAKSSGSIVAPRPHFRERSGRCCTPDVLRAMM
jgi:shikimate kinase